MIDTWSRKLISLYDTECRILDILRENITAVVSRRILLTVSINPDHYSDLSGRNHWQANDV